MATSEVERPSGASRWVRKGSPAGFLVQGSAAAFAARLLALVAGIGSQAALARLVPPESLGTYFLMQSIVLLAANVGEFGLNRPLSRMVAEDVGKGEAGPALEVLWSSLQISALSAFVVLVFVTAGPGEWLAIHVFDSRGMGDAVALLGLWIVGRIVLDIGSAALQGIHRVGVAAFLSGAIAPTFIAVASGLLLYGNVSVDFEGVVVIATSATAVSGLICLALIRSSFQGVRRSGPSRRPALIAASFPIFAGGILQVAAAQADLWIVGAQLDPEEVALYGAAKRLGGLVGFPALVLAAVVPPLMTDLYSKNQRSRLEALLRAATTVASAPMFLGLGVSLLFGREILGLIFGEAYADAVPLLDIFCAERFLFTLLGTGSLLLVMTGHERSVLRITFISSIYSLVALYLGGYLGGAIGVALGSALSSVVTAAWFFLEAGSKTGIWTHANPMAIGHIVEVLQRMTRARS